MDRDDFGLLPRLPVSLRGGRGVPDVVPQDQPQGSTVSLKGPRTPNPNRRRRPAPTTPSGTSTATPRRKAQTAAQEPAFNPTLVQSRVDEMWLRDSVFGEEKSPLEFYVGELLTDRRRITRGLQLLQDELDLPRSSSGLAESTNIADLSIPSVLSSLCKLECTEETAAAGPATYLYSSAVGTRCASMTEEGCIEYEVHKCPGGGLDRATRWTRSLVSASRMSGSVRRRIYNGNPLSFLVYNIDVTTHCGRLELGAKDTVKDRGRTYRKIPAWYGKSKQENGKSIDACGVIVSCLNRYDASDSAHVHIRSTLGEENFNFLTSRGRSHAARRRYACSWKTRAGSRGVCLCDC